MFPPLPPHALDTRRSGTARLTTQWHDRVEDPQCAVGADGAATISTQTNITRMKSNKGTPAMVRVHVSAMTAIAVELQLQHHLKFNRTITRDATTQKRKTAAKTTLEPK